MLSVHAMQLERSTKKLGASEVRALRMAGVPIFARVAQLLVSSSIYLVRLVLVTPPNTARVSL